MTHGPENPWLPPENPSRRAEVSTLTSMPVRTEASLPAPPGGTSRRKWVLPTIIVASIAVVFGVFVVAIFVVVGLIQNLQPAAPDQPLVIGEPSEPIAVAPLECPPHCFAPISIGYLHGDVDAFKVLGVPDTIHPYGTYEDVTTGEMYRRDASDWGAEQGHPDACFFAPSSAPYASSVLSADANSSDPIYFIGTHVDAPTGNVLDQAVRLFPDSASTSRFMTDLAANIDECTEIHLEFGNGERHSALVNRAAALEVPVTIASVGWIRTGTPGERWRAYIFDFQYGNVVVRNRLLTDGSILEADFRRFAENYAVMLASLEPPVN